MLSFEKGYHGRLKKREDRKTIAQSLEEKGGARILTEYLLFLKGLGLAEKTEV